MARAQPASLRPQSQGARPTRCLEQRRMQCSRRLPKSNTRHRAARYHGHPRMVNGDKYPLGEDTETEDRKTNTMSYAATSNTSRPGDAVARQAPTFSFSVVRSASRSADIDALHPLRRRRRSGSRDTDRLRIPRFYGVRPDDQNASGARGRGRGKAREIAYRGADTRQGRVEGDERVIRGLHRGI